jgi:hypothetical protein
VSQNANLSSREIREGVLFRKLEGAGKPEAGRGVAKNETKKFSGFNGLFAALSRARVKPAAASSRKGANREIFFSGNSSCLFFSTLKILGLLKP